MLQRVFPVLMIVFLLFPVSVPAAQTGGRGPHLLADINTRTSDLAKLRGFMEYQGLAYYFGGISGEMPALWKSNGTKQHTQKVKDGILGGGFLEDGKGWAVYKGILYFRAEDQQFDEELWRTDGTTAGTYRLADLAPGPQSSAPTGLVEYNGWLYFIASSQLWRTDGVKVERLTGTNVSVNVWTPLIFDELLYFNAKGSVNGSQLWRSDGTSGGTRPAIPPAGNEGIPLLADADWLYYAGSDGWTNEGGHGNEIWVTDGTLAGSRLFADIHPSGNSDPGQMMKFKGGLVFTADDGEHGREVWWTPGMTPEGNPIPPSLVVDINPGGESSFPALVGTVGDRFLFFARDAHNSSALWALSGSPPSLQRVRDAMPMPQTPDRYFDQISVVTAADRDRVYFPSFENAHGTELWVTDGTTAGTHLVVDVWPGPRGGGAYEIVHCGTGFCFPADDGNHGVELWHSDGTAAGSGLVYDLNTRRPGSDPQNLTAVGGLVYFTADDGIHGRELWRTDGTTGGTFLVKDIDPFEGCSSPPAGLTPVGDRLYFTACDLEYGLELWVTRGTPETTHRVADLYPGPGWGRPTSLTAAGSRLFFIAQTSEGQFQLWVTGPGGGASPVMAIDPDSAEKIQMVALGEDLLLRLFDPNSYRSVLWRSDGSPSGTQPFFDGLLGIGDLLGWGDRVYFSGEDIAFQWSLWQTDGTGKGTVRIPLPVEAPIYFSLYGLTGMNGTIYFFAYSSDTLDLYKTNATKTGTVLIQSFPRTQWRNTGSDLLVPYNDLLVFRMQKSDSSMVLFSSDGTPSGTQPIPLGPGYIDSLTPAGQFLYFARNDSTSPKDGHGSELWVWDGTRNTPRIVADIDPGPASSKPQSLLSQDSRLLFSANDGIAGPELWAYDIPVRQIWMPLVSR